MGDGPLETGDMFYIPGPRAIHREELHSGNDSVLLRLFPVLRIRLLSIIFILPHLNSAYMYYIVLLQH